MNFKFLLSFFLLLTAALGNVETALAIPLEGGKAEMDQLKKKVEEKRAEECPESSKRGCTCPVQIGTDSTAYGQCINTKEECNDGESIIYSCCICEKASADSATKQKILASPAGTTFETCSIMCQQTHQAEIFRQVGAGALTPTASRSAPTAQQQKAANALCFTAAVCAQEGGTFKAGMGCTGGQGRCVAPEPSIQLSFPIGSVTTVQGFRGFLKAAFDYLMMIVGLVAATMFVYGGFRYIVGSAAGDINTAKTIMFDAAIGMILVISAMAILRTINPATLDFSRLDIYMINKQQMLSAKFCSDIKIEGKPIKFADAGSPPNYTPAESASYTFNKEDTRCNYEYYAEGFGIGRCRGRKCEDSNAICVNCAGGGCENGVKKGFQCIKGAFGGNIAYADDKYAEDVDLIAVCKTSGKTNEDIEYKKVGNVTLGGKSGKEGSQTYSIAITPAEIQSAQEDCSAGLGGFLLTIEYNDPGLGAGVLTYDERAIVGRSDCGSTPTVLKAGTFHPSGEDVEDIEYAIQCGRLLGGTPLTKLESFWTFEQMMNFASGGSPQQCDIDLKSAPQDPGKGLLDQGKMPCLVK